jgi:hypothetical protein
MPEEEVLSENKLSLARNLVSPVFVMRIFVLLSATLAISCADLGTAKGNSTYPKVTTDHAASWRELPESLKPFRQSLIEREVGAACQYLSFPVTIYEVAYEPRESGESFIKTSSLVNCNMAVSTLSRLRTSWRVSAANKKPSDNLYTFVNKKIAQPCAVRWHGISVVGDVEHFSAVGLGPATSNIKFIMVDAKDNIWQPGRKGFEKAQRCRSA